MCLNKISEEGVAEIDIVCYKVFIKKFGGLLSPYRGYPWPPEGLESEVVIQDNLMGRYVEEGLHAFLNMGDADYDANYNFFSDNTVIKRMIIPKGSQYVVGKFGSDDSIVANKMIFSQ